MPGRRRPWCRRRCRARRAHAAPRPAFAGHRFALVRCGSGWCSTSACGALLSFVGGLGFRRADNGGCRSPAVPLCSGPRSRGTLPKRPTHSGFNTAVCFAQFRATWNGPGAQGHHHRPARLPVVFVVERHSWWQGVRFGCAGAGTIPGWDALSEQLLWVERFRVVVYGWYPWSVDRRTRTRTAHHVEPSHACANK